ncbi:hypothetical protein AAFF_G00112370 [Aldrovandia affinis]|uniref:Reverse transcriptase RNase H-like domain-containing protein n=1 Tax=Aldrovandia affinis TaxID=143900 RepID=A0AAD7WAI1_9TELE|nr:hypothetical protein AAFF_G00112370 [Aldrovandia affinis]
MNQFQVTPPEKFTFKLDDWPKWIKRSDRFRIASGLETQADENQINALIYTMGEKAEDILVSLHLSPEEASEYDTVKGKLDAHFVARRNVIFERAKFNQWQQEMGESADCFITALHCLAKHCGYGTLHDEMVRDRLVVGLRDRRLSEQLQMDPELTLQKAVTRAKQMMTADAGDRPWMTEVKMDNHNTVFKIDTGADVTAVPETLYTQGQFSTLVRATLVLKGPGRVPLKVKGNLEGLSTPLLSQPAATALQLVARLEDFSLNSKETIKQEFPKLFSGLGKMEGEYNIVLKPGAKPFSLSTPRRISLPLLPKIKDELHRMEQQGVISKVEEPTEWCAPIVVVPKSAGRGEAGVTLNDKCEFSKCKIKFLGQIIEASGISADPDKVSSVRAMKKPSNVSERRDNAEWKPVAYASRALSSTEQRYAQIEEAALASTWACERFARAHEFLIGKSFSIEMDHKPLVPLLGSRNLDELPPRIQRLRMRLMRFSYTISHVPGKEIATADVLSRAPVAQRGYERKRSTCVLTLS